MIINKQNTKIIAYNGNRVDRTRIRSEYDITQGVDEFIYVVKSQVMEEVVRKFLVKQNRQKVCSVK